MDPQYLQQLLDMLAASQGGGGLMAGMDQGMVGDPYAPSGGFPSPAMPNGKMPQYRTQGSGFISDGTVRDMLGKVMVNQDQFSPDAFFALDPMLKPLVARAVAEGGHDPYATYSLLDDDPYRKALVEQIQRSEGLDPVGVDYSKYTDTNGDSKVDAQDLTYDQFKGEIDAGYAGQRKTRDTGLRNMYGDAVNSKDLYTDILNQRIAGAQAGLDDFITQAAPSQERNLNQMDFTWGRLGGMPYQGQGGGAIDYAGTGPEFGGGDPLAQAAGALPAGDDPAMGAYVEQFLRANGVDIEGNRRRRDTKKAAINSGVRRQAAKNPQGQKPKDNGSKGKNDTWYMKALKGDLSGIRLPGGAGILG